MRLSLLIAAASIGAAVPASASQPRQQPPPQPQPQARTAVPAPDQHLALRLLWSTMAAVDQANRTGNYSVLRDLGTLAFQANNNPAALAGIFAGLRGRNVELSEALMVTPVWEIAPAMTTQASFRMRGTFPLRPTPIAFDLIYTWEGGAWRLDGVAVQALQPSAR